MRATNTGKRRGVRNKIRETQGMKRGPKPKVQSQYENMPEHFPGLHVGIAPIDAPRDVVAPTVAELLADGFKVIEDAPIPIPAGHQMICMDAVEFERRQILRQEEANMLLDPTDQPRTEEEMRAVIQQKIGTNNVGQAHHITTAPRVTLEQATAVLAKNEIGRDANPGEAGETPWVPDTE